jgi:nucleoid-associated protein YgaU
MRHLCLITLLILTISLTACGRGDSLPTLVPTADPGLVNGTSIEDESPRATADPGLPPTWTPPAAVELATPVPLPGTTPTSTITYVIQPGDTLGQIAARYGVTVAELARLNSISNIDRIEVGDTLLIPQPAE